VRVALAMAVLMVLGAACVPAPAAVERKVDRLPVVIVPGFELTCGQNSRDWDAWVDALVDDGVPRSWVSVFNYDTCRPPEEITEELGERVRAVVAATGAPRVRIIAHSLGSILSRWCMRFGECAGLVDTHLSLAPANHGTIWANLCPVAFWHRSCGAMTPDGPFLAALNADDETWGDTRYVTASSWCDLAIVPSVWGTLEGAENHTLARCVEHSAWKVDPAAVTWGVATLAGRAVPPLA